MKKIFLFSLIGCLGIVESFFADTYNCVPQELKWNQIKAQNQFLFPTPGHYNGNGTALVCGHQGANGCATGTVIVMAGNHVWTDSNKEKEIRGGMDAYVCNTSGFNAWQNNALGFLKECDSGQKKSWDKIGEIQGQKILCADKKDVFNRNGYCKKACFTSDCPDCDKTGSQPDLTPQPTPTPTPTPKPNPKNTCAEMYKGYPERIACCKAGAATEWIGDLETGKCLCKRYIVGGSEIPMRPSLNKSNGVQCIPNISWAEAECCVKAGGTWHADDAEEVKGHCDCGSGKKFHFKPQEQKCECIPGDGDNSTPIPTTCTKTDCVITINQSIKCSYNNNYLNSTEIYSVCKEDLDAQRLDCNGLKTRVNACADTDCIRKLLTRIDAYDELIERVCGGSGVVTTPVPDNGAEILAAENTLTSFFRNAESDASVWKDKDGNFNTARLASDLTAGVILGTVGGVVSGVVIKKKQVEKGFDALHCTVGGQTVADWGDIFNVGLRR